FSETPCVACGSSRMTRSRTPDTNWIACSMDCSPTTSNPCRRSARASRRSGYGRPRRIPRHLHRPIGRCGLCPPRFPEEAAGHVETGHRAGEAALRPPEQEVTMSKTTTKPDRFASVWDALADSTEEAANLKVRAELMRKI